MEDEQKQSDRSVSTEPAEQTTCCIVGAGPGGAMLALLLARQGVEVILLEEHMDFEREFRGDTLHPAAMENLHEIGLAKRLLQLRHTRVKQIGVQTGSGTLLHQIEGSHSSKGRNQRRGPIL